MGWILCTLRDCLSSLSAFPSFWVPVIVFMACWCGPFASADFFWHFSSGALQFRWNCLDRPRQAQDTLASHLQSQSHAPFAFATYSSDSCFACPRVYDTRIHWNGPTPKDLATGAPRAPRAPIAKCLALSA